MILRISHVNMLLQLFWNIARKIFWGSKRFSWPVFTGIADRPGQEKCKRTWLKLILCFEGIERRYFYQIFERFLMCYFFIISALLNSIFVLQLGQTWLLSYSSENISTSVPQLGHLIVIDLRSLNWSNPGQCCGVGMTVPPLQKGC